MNAFQQKFWSRNCLRLNVKFFLYEETVNEASAKVLPPEYIH